MLEGARALAAAVGAAKEGTAREVAFGCGWEDRAEAAVLEVRVEGALFIVGAEFLTGGFDLGRAREDSGADCFLVWVDAVAVAAAFCAFSFCSSSSNFLSKSPKRKSSGSRLLLGFVSDHQPFVILAPWNCG